MVDIWLSMVDVWLSMVVVWWDILYETLYCLPPARASQPLETRPKVVDAEFEISQRFLPRRPVSSDRRDDGDDVDGDVDGDGDDDDDVNDDYDDDDAPLHRNYDEFRDIDECVTNQRTDTANFRDARTHLKTGNDDVDEWWQRCGL